jgi:hypothetical protein
MSANQIKRIIEGKNEAVESLEEEMKYAEHNRRAWFIEECEAHIAKMDPLLSGAELIPSI